MALPGSSLRLLGGRFALVRPLRESLGVRTLLVRDLSRDGAETVLKALSVRLAPGGAADRLSHDLLALSSSATGALVPLCAAGSEADELMWATPLVNGPLLSDSLAQRPLSVSDALAVADALFTALEEAHRAGVLHRDVRACHVILRPVRLPGAPAAQLFDFGLSRAAVTERRGQPSADQVRDLSPEQNGLLAADVNERSDLFSAGCVLYQCLTGQSAFLGDSAAAALRAQLTVKPVSPSVARPEVPRALSELTLRLLSKDPRGRYGSAAGVLSDLRQIAQRVAEGEPDPQVVLGTQDLHQGVREPSFVGRKAELAALSEGLSRARAGQRTLILLEGESGRGKSHLLEEAAGSAAAAGAWVLRGQGLGQAAQRPFQLLQGVAREVERAARLEPELSHRLSAATGKLRSGIAALFPQLRSAMEAADGESERPGPDTFGDERNLLLLSCLLDALGTAERPAVVLLDDVQWGDDATVRLLSRWSRGESARAHTLIVAAFRSEEVSQLNPLLRARSFRQLKLGPMSPAELSLLTASMAGPLPQAGQEALESLAGGSPFLATVALQGLVELEVLKPGSKGWDIDGERLSRTLATGRAAYLSGRLDQLPGETLRLLAAAAVAGRTFNASLIAEAIELPAPSALIALQEARRRHLVWSDAQGGVWGFSHDQVREALLLRLFERDRRLLHARIARALVDREQESSGESSESSDRSYEIAYHFDGAGESAQARPYAMRAARAARARYALELAEQLWRIAAKNAESEASDADRLEMLRALGESLFLRGRYRESRAELTAALDLAQRPEERAEILGMLGDSAFQQSDNEGARGFLFRALEELGCPPPRERIALPLLREAAVQTLHTLLPSLLLARRKRGVARDLQLVRLYGRLSYLFYWTRGAAWTLWSHLREMNLAERCPPSDELAFAWSKHGPAMSMIPWHSRALGYTARSVALRRRMGNVWGEGQSLSFYATSLYASARFVEAREAFAQARELLARTGDRWEAGIAAHMRAYCHFQLGEVELACSAVDAIYREALEVGDMQLASLALSCLSRVSGGQVEEGAFERALAAVDHTQPNAMQQCLQGAGLAHLYAGELNLAQAALERARDVIEESGVRNLGVATAPLFLAQVYRLKGQAAQGEERARFFAAAKAQLREASRTNRKFIYNQPQILRETAILSALSGKLRHAQRSAQGALEVARRLGQVLETLQCELLLARLEAARGRPRVETAGAFEARLGQLHAAFLLKLIPRDFSE